MNVKLAKIAIIAGDAELAELVCSRLRTAGIYLPVVEAPMIRLVKYGIFDQDCLRVANLLRNIGAKTFLCLKVESKTLESLQKCMPGKKLINLESYDEKVLGTLVQLKNTVIKREDLVLEDATCFTEDIFVVEKNESDLSAVIATNLASAHGGGVVFIDPASEQDAEFAREQSRLWSYGTSEEKQQAKTSLFDFLKMRLPQNLIKSQSIRSLSFITRGLPYGMLPFNCPTTHFFSFPLLGLNVLAGIVKSQEIFRCPIAVLIDPRVVGDSEFLALKETFYGAGYYLRSAFGRNATARNASCLTAYLPSDFIFYSTHCGEQTGQRIVERFPDRNGNSHVISYDRVLSGFHSPTEETDDLFEIMVMKRWVSNIPFWGLMIGYSLELGRWSLDVPQGFGSFAQFA